MTRGNAALKHVYQHSIKGFTIGMPCAQAQRAFGNDAMGQSLTPDSTVHMNPRPPGKGPGGGGGVSQILDDAVTVAAAQSGAYFVLAAGNEGDGANGHSPARANGPNVFTISASDINDRMASFSNFGNPPVDYAASDVGVLSTKKGAPRSATAEPLWRRPMPAPF